jgi:hypothetical protein
MLSPFTYLTELYIQKEKESRFIFEKKVFIFDFFGIEAVLFAFYQKTF